MFLRQLSQALAVSCLLIASCAAQTSIGSTACGDIQNIIGSAGNSSVTVTADQALACLQSMPFNKTAASQFVQLYNSSVLPFQSTIEYLRKPPQSYQQPPVDLFGGMDTIQNRINSGSYSNHYDFEADVQQLIRSANDGHLSLSTGALSVFVFSAPVSIVAASSDGKELPKIYIANDLVAINSGATGFTVSALDSINGQHAAQFVQDFAKNFSSGNLDSNTAFNSMMFSAVGYVSTQAIGNEWSASKVYTGSSLNMTFENGTSQSMGFIAEVAPSAQGVLLSAVSTGQDFYDNFAAAGSASGSQSAVSGQSRGSQISSSGSGVRLAQRDDAQGWSQPAFPTPFLSQSGLGQITAESGAYVTAYMLKDISLGVLSIPNFGMSGADETSMSSLLASFLTQTKDAGMKHILIDVRSNPGGTSFDSFEVFKNFFPQTYPYMGSRMRENDLMDIMGTADTNLYLDALASNNQTIQQDLEGSPWVAMLWDNTATGQPFTSWDDLGRHVPDNGGFFTQTQLNNLSDVALDLAMTSNGTVIDGYGNRSQTNVQAPYAASDIAILTDGFCHSTCTEMVDMFHHVAGVKIVTIGGLPKAGPMQGVAGVRSPNDMDISSLVSMVDSMVEMFPNLTSKLPDFSQAGINVTGGSVNLRDMIHANESFPQQFAYQDADCRLFHTFDSWNNYTQLWSDAAAAMWGNGSICVPGSTNQPSASSNITNTTGPAGGPNSKNGWTRSPLIVDNADKNSTNNTSGSGGASPSSSSRPSSSSSLSPSATASGKSAASKLRVTASWAVAFLPVFALLI